MVPRYVDNLLLTLLLGKGDMIAILLLTHILGKGDTIVDDSLPSDVVNLVSRLRQRDATVLAWDDP